MKQTMLFIKKTEDDTYSEVLKHMEKQELRMDAMYHAKGFPDDTLLTNPEEGRQRLAAVRFPGIVIEEDRIFIRSLDEAMTAATDGPLVYDNDTFATTTLKSYVAEHCTEKNVLHIIDVGVHKSSRSKKRGLFGNLFKRGER